MIKKVLIGLAFVLIALAVYLVLATGRIEAKQINDDVWVLTGLGGNVGVLRTDAGTVIVDTMTFERQGKAIRAKAAEVTGQAVVMIINSHYHLDHTHGNPAFKNDNIRVVATQRTLEHLHHFDADTWAGSASSTLPNETFETTQTIELGGKTIQLLHPGRGHTDGDLVAVFVEDRVIHMGDLLFNKHYPNIDLEAGGSINDWPTTLEAVLELSFDQVIPGHGEVTDAAGIRQFQSFMSELGDLGRAAAAAGKNLEQTQTDVAKQLTTDAGYSEISMIVPTGLDQAFVIKRSWEEATGAVKPLN